MDNKEFDNKKEYYNNNYNNINTDPGVRITRETGAMISAAYEQSIGSALNCYVARAIESALSGGITVAQVLDAIRITAFAPRPSGAYLRAILRNWQRDGVTQAPKESPAWWQNHHVNPALNYEQREYRNDDFVDESYLEIGRAFLARGGNNEHST